MIDIPPFPASPVPPPGRIVVGAYLRGLRESRGLYMKEVVRRVEYTVSSISRMERVYFPPDSSVLVARLLKVYGVNKPHEIRAVTDLLEQDGQHLDPHSARARDRLASCWRASSAVRMYAGHWLPPALHTLDYARVYTDVHRIDLHGPSSGIRFPPPTPERRLTLLIDEDVLVRPVGEPDVMAGQIDRLQQLIEQGSLVVRVVPLDRPGTFVRPPCIQLDPYGYSLFVETSAAGMRYSTGTEPGAALDRVEDAALRLGVGYDRLEAARLVFAGGRS